MAFFHIPVFEDEAKPDEVAYCRECKHGDCEATRKLRSAKCKLCDKQFQPREKVTGYGGLTIGQVAHFDCVLIAEGV